MSDDPKDPRFKTFRAVSLGLYLTVTCGFSALIIFSVYLSVLRMTPERPPVAGARLSEAECLQEARTLFIELEQERKALGDRPDVSHADQRFLQFRVEWLTRKRAVEARCALDTAPRARAAFASLDRVLDLYTTASVQFTGGVGPAVDELKTLLEGKPTP